MISFVGSDLGSLQPLSPWIEVPIKSYPLKERFDKVNRCHHGPCGGAMTKASLWEERVILMSKAVVRKLVFQIRF